MTYRPRAIAIRALVCFVLVLSVSAAPVRANGYCCGFCNYCDPCDQPCGVVWIADCGCGDASFGADSCGEIHDSQYGSEDCCSTSAADVTPKPSQPSPDASEDDSTAASVPAAKESASQEQLPGPRRTYRVEEPSTEPEPAAQSPTPAAGSFTASPPPGVAVPTETSPSFDEVFSDPKPGPAEAEPSQSAAPAETTEQPSPSVVGDRYSRSSESLPRTVEEADERDASPEETPKPGGVSVEGLFEEPTSSSAPLPSGANSFPTDSEALPEVTNSDRASSVEEEGEENDDFLDRLMGPAGASDEDPDDGPAESTEENTPKAGTPDDSEPQPGSSEENPDDSEENSLLDDLLGDITRGSSDSFFAPSHEAEFRLWHDREGQRSCLARVLRYTTEGLIMERADGVQVRLSFRHMSDRDLAYVELEVKQAHAELRRRRAAAQLAGSWTP